MQALLHDVPAELIKDAVQRSVLYIWHRSKSISLCIRSSMQQHELCANPGRTPSGALLHCNSKLLLSEIALCILCHYLCHYLRHYLRHYLWLNWLPFSKTMFPYSTLGNSVVAGCVSTSAFTTLRGAALHARKYAAVGSKTPCPC